MLNYITFDTNEKFVQWQEETERKIISISPMMSEINLDISEYDDGSNIGKSADGRGKTNIGVFVVYSTDE